MSPVPHSPDKRKHIISEQVKFLQKLESREGMLEILHEKKQIRQARKVIKELVPLKPEGGTFLRIGGEADGGYVMLDPGRDGIAYSLGVSTYSPWDLEMAERGFKVFQYDGSIDKEPDEHPNIFFHKYFICGSPQKGPYKTLPQILFENGHEDERDIILQMDIENAEWDVLRELDAGIMLNFKQIVIELHHIQFSNCYPVLKKLRETHTPVHFHYNNRTHHYKYIQELDFIYCDFAIEMTYVRNKDFNFSEYDEYFPRKLDRPNIIQYGPDVPIGYFDLLAARL